MHVRQIEYKITNKEYDRGKKHSKLLRGKNNFGKSSQNSISFQLFWNYLPEVQKLSI